MMRYVKMELHTHTLHSDGTMAPERLVQRAIERGYTAIVSTDHNTVTAVPHLKRYAMGTPLSVIAGIEWTTFWGHIVVSGGNSPVDWREVTRENVNLCLKRAHDSGDATTIAHPTRLGGRICTGCRNDYDITDWQYVDAIEISSQESPHNHKENDIARSQWHALLAKGYKIAAVHGYDWHNEDMDCPPYGVTYVGIEGEPTESSFVEAIRGGRTTVGVGVKIRVVAEQDGNEYGIGDTMHTGRLRVKVRAEYEYPFAEKYAIQVQRINLVGTALNCASQADGLVFEGTANKGYFVVEITGIAAGSYGTLAVSSPIYVEDII